jgi:hypothetical protein
MLQVDDDAAWMDGIAVPVNREAPPPGLLYCALLPMPA